MTMQQAFEYLIKDLHTPFYKQKFIRPVEMEECAFLVDGSGFVVYKYGPAKNEKIDSIPLCVNNISEEWEEVTLEQLQKEWGKSYVTT